MRGFANENELVATIESIPDLALQAVDFATIPFSEQMKLVHNTSILVGMHGGGLFHTITMNIARPCAVVEIFPKRWGGGRGPTIQHMARLLGIKYYSIESREEETVAELRKRGKGTTIEAGELRRVIETAAAEIRSRAPGEPAAAGARG